MKVSFLRSAFWVSFLILLSRISGFFREYLFVALVGVGAASDAFTLAFRLPSFFRRIFSEGAFQVTFLPIFTELKEKQGEDAAFRFASHLLGFFVLILIALVGFIEWRFDLLGHVLLGRQTSAETTSHFLSMGRIMFPYIFFISLTTFWGSIASAYGRFGFFNFSHALSNLVIVVFVLGMLWLGPKDHAAYESYFAWGILLSGFMQWVWMMAGCWAHGLGFKLSFPKWTPSVQFFFKKFFSGIMSVSAIQLNTLISISLAARLPVGGVSYLNYGDRLNQLWLSLVGVSLSSVLLPTLAYYLSSGQKAKAWRVENQVLRLGCFLGGMACVFLALFSFPLISFLLGHLVFKGKITVNDLHAIGQTAAVLSTGIPACVLIKTLNAKLFANGNTKIPLWASFVNVGIDLCMSLALMKHFGHLGLAAASSLGAWGHTFFIFYYLKKKEGWTFHRTTARSLRRLVLATLLMWGLGKLVFTLLIDLTTLYHYSFYVQVGVISLLSIAAFVGYLGITTLVGVFSLRELRVLTRAFKKPRLSSLKKTMGEDSF